MSRVYPWFDWSAGDFHHVHPILLKDAPSLKDGDFSLLADERDGQYSMDTFLCLARQHETSLVTIKPSSVYPNYIVLEMFQHLPFSENDKTFRVRYSSASVAGSFSEVLAIAKFPACIAAAAYATFRWREALGHTWRLLQDGQGCCDQGARCSSVEVCLGALSEVLRSHLMAHTPLPADLCHVTVGFSV